MDRRKPQPPMVGSPRTHSLSSSAHGSTRTHALTSAARMATSRDSHNHMGRSAPSSSSAAVIGKTRHIPLENLDEEEDWKRHGRRGSKHVPEDPRLTRQHATAAAASTSAAGNGDSSTAHASKKRPKVPEKVSYRVI